MSRRTTILLLLLLLSSTALYAQFEASYTQYMFNGLAINPAYAGSHNSLDATLITRFQSPGVEGAPSTQTIAAHSGIKDKKIGLGVMLITDKVGVTRQTGFYASFAYKIKFENSTLSMGLQGGATNYRSDYTQLLIKQPGDPLVNGDVRETLPNIGAGIYYYSKMFYAGLSMPQMVSANETDIIQSQPVIFTTGVVLPINDAFKLKPNLLIRTVEEQLAEIHANLNLLIHEILWVGVSYRINSSVSGLLELQLTNQLRLGYAYDATLTDLGQVNSGSHELMLNYQLRFSKKKVVNPRYF